MNDPLQISVPLAGVSTDVPLLPEGIYSFQVSESSAGPNKAGTGMNWSLKLALTAPATSVDNKPINVNFPVFMQLALQAKEDSKDPDAFRRSLAETVDALFGTTQDNRPELSHDLITQAVGKVVNAQITIDEYEGRKSNKVRRLKKAE